MNLFAYGTLIFEEILSKLLGAEHISIPGLLENYKIIKFYNAEYPGIIPDIESNVSGKIIFGINEQDISILDAYEGVMYKRSILKVKALSKEYDCHVYVVDDNYREELSEEPWCPIDFKNNSLNNYMKNLD